MRRLNRIATVVLGLVLFLIGGAYGWAWVRNRWVIT